jgi:hypothetical protein
MSLGATIQSQQCRAQHAPNFLQGAIQAAQKCQGIDAPEIFIWVKRLAQQCRHLSTQGKGYVVGAEMPTQPHPSQPVTGGHHRCAEMPYRLHPRQFWCQGESAEMLLLMRTKGGPKVTCRNAIREVPPHQFYLVPRQDRKNAITATHQGGANRRSQQCLSKSALPNQSKGSL